MSELVLAMTELFVDKFVTPGELFVAMGRDLVRAMPDDCFEMVSTLSQYSSVFTKLWLTFFPKNRWFGRW